MPEEIDDPYYLLALAMVRRTVMDALDGGELEELVWLFSPLAQMAIQRALGLNDVGAMVATRRTVKALAKAVKNGDGDHLQHFISQKAFIVLEDWTPGNG
jgi:hypothetical protein